jgi:ankyrin repeat protein
MALLSDVRTDVHATWKLGVSSFELCIQQKLPKVLQHFLSIGISPNRKYRGDTPMHLAVESNWIEGVQILLDTRKVPHSAVNHQGETALELARRLGHDQIESLLRKR